ncbi:MAG: PQQ-binding-like beta-propeller repeat protein, partial [Phycisphaerales bacterium]
MRKTACHVLLKMSLSSLFCILLVSRAAGANPPVAGQKAAEILTATGVRGGLIIHIGCGDGKLTAALAANSNCLVHGLDKDAKKVQAARRHIQSSGLYGTATAEQWAAKRLPYIDNLANLVVAENRAAVSMKEVMRILRPDGVAYINKMGKWIQRHKAWPEDIDEWTHFLHDASGNAVSHDDVVGPPRHMQWLAGPQWDRNHHKLASISSVVSAKGRVFSIVDEATAGSLLVPGRWSLVARDAFNGVRLWTRPMPSWAYERYGFRAGPVQLPRLLVAVADRVYMPLGMNKAVSAFDAATGDTIATYEQTEGAEEIIVAAGVLLVVKGSPVAEQAAIHPESRGGKGFTNNKSIVAIETETGEQLWTWREGAAARLMPLTLAAKDGRVFFQAGNGVTCLDLKTGAVLWCTAPVSPEAAQSEQPNETKQTGADRTDKMKRKKAKTPKRRRGTGWSTATLAVYEDLVLWADGPGLKVLSTKDGSQLWQCPCKAGFKSPVDVFVADGLVWVGPEYNVGRDLRSGDIKRRLLALEDLRTAGHHHRCYRERATDRYIIGGYRGMEFFDLSGDNHSRNNWVRGTCQYGILPCNGLVYAPPHACGCFMEAKLYGFWALAAEGNRRTRKPRPARLDKGPAYAHVSSHPRSPATCAAEEWPTYRHDPLRSGSTPAVVPSTLKRAWKVEIAERITPPVVAQDTVLISAIDEHRVIALKASDGSARWTFTAGGRIDS